MKFQVFPCQNDNHIFYYNKEFNTIFCISYENNIQFGVVKYRDVEGRIQSIEMNY